VANKAKLRIGDLPHYLKDHNLPPDSHTPSLQTLLHSHHIQGHHLDSSTSNPTNCGRGRPKLAASTLAHAWPRRRCPRRVLHPLTHSLGLGVHAGHLRGGLSHGADVGEQAPGRHGGPQHRGSCRVRCWGNGAPL